MIIDQLPILASVQETDEIPVERGTTTYKATLDKIAPVRSVNGETGDVRVSPLAAYPVGSIYMSVNSTDPGTIFGGTWERLENRFLLGAGSDYAAGATGGEATHTLTIDEMPSHNHGFKRTTSATASGSNFARMATNGDVVDDLITNTGGGQAHNNMPPYLAVYMWKRTA
jgi:hypothetical protein